MAEDRSRYRNPDIPVGYGKPEPRLVYEMGGVMIEGLHYLVAHILHEVNVENRPDRHLFEDLSFLSDSDDDDASIVFFSNTKGKKETVKIKKEPDENDNVKKKNQTKKKDLKKNTASSLDDFYLKMEIDPEKGAKKKTKRIKKERSDSNSPSRNRKHYSPLRHHTSSKEKGSHRSDSNSPSRNIKHRSPSRSRTPSREKLVHYSRSPSPEDVKVKLEPLEPGIPQHLYGSYHCDVCNITMNSLLTFNTHQHGKRHAKVLKLKTMEALGKNIPFNTASENKPKFPNASAGCIRRKVLTQSIIQEYVEQNITKPCPGLSFIIEIQGLEKLNYYCNLCDSPCSPDSLLPHLNGYKHQLHCLKHFKPGAYEAMQYEPKYKIEAEIKNILYAVEKKEGRGRISVEIEELVSSTDIPQSQTQPSKSHPSASTHQQKKSSATTHHQSQPSTSKGTDSNRSASSFHEMYRQATVPDSKSSDYFCPTCQSHMNSLQMWESHIRGKRHLTNLKKLPGDKPSKTKTILVPNKKAYLMDRIKREIPNEPVVGLREIRETEIIENKSHSYQCFLCGSCHTSLDILEHLISLKHRGKYLEHIRFPGVEVTYGMSDAIAFGLVRDMCVQVEAREGSGHPEVHVNKNFLGR